MKKKRKNQHDPQQDIRNQGRTRCSAQPQNKHHKGSDRQSGNKIAWGASQTSHDDGFLKHGIRATTYDNKDNEFIFMYEIDPNKQKNVIDSYITIRQNATKLTVKFAIEASPNPKKYVDQCPYFSMGRVDEIKQEYILNVKNGKTYASYSHEFKPLYLVATTTRETIPKQPFNIEYSNFNVILNNR